MLVWPARKRGGENSEGFPVVLTLLLVKSDFLVVLGFRVLSFFLGVC